MNLKNIWSKKKVQHFLFVHLMLMVGIFTVPLDIWYLYGLIFFLLFTLPIFSVTHHLYFNHGYVEFKHPIYKLLVLLYIVLNSFWKFSDVKSYHIQHHQAWLTAGDPTAVEIQQGYFKYYVGLTDPVAISKVEVPVDTLIEFLNRYFVEIKLLLTVAVLVLFGWKVFVHLVIIQQFLMFVFNKIHDIIFHKTLTAKDMPWLAFIYGNDAWHISHHAEYDKHVWYTKYIPQYFYTRLLFK